MPDEEYWAPLTYSVTPLDDVMVLRLTTDVPVHLYMRWTLIEIQRHIDPVYRRGIFMHANPRFCFVAWEENEQIQAGDTLIHCFVKPDWTLAQVRWFYFIGTINGQPSPSMSPIFSWRNFPPPADLLIRELWTT